MTENQTKDVARRFILAWNAGQARIVDELAAPEIAVFYSHFAEPLRGPDAFKKMLAQTWESFPDLLMEPEDPIVDGRVAVVPWAYTGTHQRHEIAGIRPTGALVRVSGVSIYRIARGKVVEEGGVVDTMGLMLQLGATLVPGTGNSERGA